jgi:ABC-type ATPase involved in cell division
LLYGSGNWTVKTRDATRITAAEMKYIRRTAGYTWTDHKTNTEFAKELNITLVLDKIQEREVGYSMLIEGHVRDDPA